jgi:hypothetical protein
MSDMAMQRAMAVKARYESYLLRKANVLSVGVGYRERRGKLTDQVVLVVNVSRKLPRNQLHPEDIVPSTIEDVPVDVRETGPLRAF